MPEYRRGAHTIFEIHLHLVWITKYRRPALTGDVAVRVRDLVREICGATRSEDNGGARSEGSCAFVPFDSAASNDQLIAAMVEGQNSPSFVGGISALEEAVLGTAPVGARLFLLQFWECNR